MKTILLTSLLLILAVQSFAQQTVTLEMCRHKAIENYPLTRQQDILPQALNLKMESLNKNYLPQISITGQAHYQSDVTKTPIQDIPGLNIPTVDKDWYKVALDVNQVIYDASATKRQKKVETAGYEIDRQSLEVELYHLKNRVRQVYFTLLLLRENQKVLQLHYDHLKSKLPEVESAVLNGALLSSNADILRAELIRSEQATREIEISIASAIAIMNEITLMELTEKTIFLPPDVEEIPATFSNNRPELGLFNLQQSKIEASKELLGSSILPRLSAFGQAGYGRPGYDMLNVNFDDFYMIGVRLHWKPWDWHASRKEKEILSLQNEVIETRKDAFDQNLKIELENIIAEIRKTEEWIARDLEIITLREKITKSYSSQLDNGIITATQYLSELTAESNARLDLERHRIMLLKERLDYITALGNEF